MMTFRGCWANPELQAINKNETNNCSLKILIAGLFGCSWSSNSPSICLSEIQSISIHELPTNRKRQNTGHLRLLLLLFVRRKITPARLQFQAFLVQFHFQRMVSTVVLHVLE